MMKKNLVPILLSIATLASISGMVIVYKKLKSSKTTAVLPVDNNNWDDAGGYRITINENNFYFKKNGAYAGRDNKNGGGWIAA